MTLPRTRSIPVFLMWMFTSLMCESAFSQSTTSIRGTILDPSDAVVAGAAISLENIGTGATRLTTSDEVGFYKILQVVPGIYRIRAEHAGFKSVVGEGIQLLVNTPSTLSLKFQQVGQISETVQVSERLVPLINTVDATIGNTIQNRQVVALPLDSRNVAGLLSLQPGVVFTGIDDKVAPDTRGGATAGARSDQTNITLDGVDVNDQQTGEAFKSVLPVTLDSIQEFRVVTVGANASQGRSSGGQVSMVTKSGSNLFRGSLYEYHRNSASGANDYFNNSTVSPLTGKTLEKPKLIRNVFGGSVGGPIRKNRLFFFLNAEDTITRWEEPQLRIVPSSSLRQGILQYVDVSGAVRAMPPGQLQQLDPRHIGVNPAVLALFQQYPLGNDPTQGGDDGLNFSGFRFNAPMQEDKPSYIGRIDYVSSDQKHNIFVRGALANFRQDEQPAQFPGQPAARVLLTNSKGIVAGHTWAKNPRLLNDFRWAFTRQALDFTGASTAPGLTLFGVDTLQNFNARNNSRRLPVHNLTDDVTWVKGRHSLQFGADLRTIHNKRFSEERTYSSYFSNFAWMESFGMDVLPADIDEGFAFPYVNAQMALLGTISQAEVTYFANRDGSIFPRPHIPRREFINNEFEWYVQDQLQLSRQLTMTVGLRYSYFAPPYEKNGFQVRPSVDVNEWFAKRRDGGAIGVPSNANPLLSFILAGKSNNAAPIFDPDKNNFAPRFALAWSPSYSDGVLHTLFGNSGQSSIRFGAAVFFDRTGGTFPVTTDLNGAVGLATLLRTPTAAFNYETAPRFTGFENVSSIPVPAAPKGGFPATLGFTNNGGFMVDSGLRTPYSTALNFSISRSLPSDLSVEAAYIGRVGKKLLIQNDLASPLVNFKDPKSGQTWVQAAGIIADLLDRNTDPSQVPRIPFFENVFAPMAQAGTSATEAFYNHMALFAPSWTDGLHSLDASDDWPTGATIYGKHTFFQQQFDTLPAWTNLGQSSYHSLQLSLQKRLSRGLQAGFNYTLAKSLDNGSSVESEGLGVGQILNSFDHRQSLGFSDFDIRHQINSNFLVDLPVGRDRRFGASLSPVLQGVLGGWSLSGLARWRTGFPFGASGNGFFFPTNYFITGPPTLSGQRPQTKVTKSATSGPNIFVDPEKAYDAFEYTRSGFSGTRNALHGPGFFTLDTGVQKNFNVAENQQVQFRWETFNLTNTVNFDGRANQAGNRGIDFNLIGKSSFGRLRSLAGSPRIMQFALRYQF